MNLDWISPDWPAPAHVHALITTRKGGVSKMPYDTLNLADHVHDEKQAVLSNRTLLREQAGLSAEPAWLKQDHGARVVKAEQAAADECADGSTTARNGVACVVLTADCLPVFLCDRSGSQVAVLHAGWRGMANGILESGVAAMKDAPSEILAYLGPAIGPHAFEIGPEVRACFIDCNCEAALAFQQHGEGKWLADIYLLARQRLNAVGVEAVYGGGRCTLSEPEHFFSYRRDGECGRMASLIWIT
ncbi:MAG: peptidoglycan editing factor PgeF [Gammaproteobacteria bacterium]|nr:MAG: peptidoglycan editing factor PgeF [Gammaproteobacteria bacterium]